MGVDDDYRPPASNASSMGGIRDVNTSGNSSGKSECSRSTTGAYVGRAKAVKLYNDELSRSKILEAEIALAQSLTELNTRIGEMEVCDNRKVEENGSTTGLTTRAGLYLDRVTEVARKSRSVKGDLIKVVNDSVMAVRVIMGTLAGRSTNEEVRTLRAANQRLQEDMDGLRKQMEALKERLDSAPLAQRVPRVPSVEKGQVAPQQVMRTRNSTRSARECRREMSAQRR